MIAASLAVDEGYVWNVSADGIAKASRLDEYKAQGRGGSGLISMRREAGDPDLAAAAIGRLDENVLVLTNKRKAKRISLGVAKVVKRAAAGGSPVIALREKERVVALTIYRRRIEVADALLESPIAAKADEDSTVDQPPRQYELSLKEIQSLLDEADGVDASGNGASGNGADPDAPDDE